MHRVGSCIDVIIPGSFFNFFSAMRRRGPQVSTRWGGGQKCQLKKWLRAGGRKSFGSYELHSVRDAFRSLWITFALTVSRITGLKVAPRLACIKLKGSGERRAVAFEQASVCCRPGPLRSRSRTSCRCPACRTWRCSRTWTSARSRGDCWRATMFCRFWPTRGWVCGETCLHSARHWERRHFHCMRSRVRLE